MEESKELKKARKEFEKTPPNVQRGIKLVRAGYEGGDAGGRGVRFGILPAGRRPDVAHRFGVTASRWAGILRRLGPRVRHAAGDNGRPAALSSQIITGGAFPVPTSASPVIKIMTKRRP